MWNSWKLVTVTSWATKTKCIVKEACIYGHRAILLCVMPTVHLSSSGMTQKMMFTFGPRARRLTRDLEPDSCATSGLSCPIYSFSWSTVTRSSSNTRTTSRLGSLSGICACVENKWASLFGDTTILHCSRSSLTDCSVTRREMDEDTLYLDERGRANGLTWLRDSTGWGRSKR